jgi:hypothetical protein
MDSMRVAEFLKALDEFREKLIEHRKLWGESLSQPMPSYPVRNNDELEKQSDWLTRRLGAIRPYIERFDDQWIMRHPATGVVWDALDTSTGLGAVSQIKGASLRSTVEKLNTIAGRLESLDPDDIVPADRAASLKSGLSPDRIILAYLNHLHPYIAKGCTKLFVDGHYAQAVEESAKAVFQYLRDASCLTFDGTTLAQQAFSLKSPILAFSEAGQTYRSRQRKMDPRDGGYFRKCFFEAAHRLRIGRGFHSKTRQFLSAARARTAIEIRPARSIKP